MDVGVAVTDRHAPQAAVHAPQAQPEEPAGLDVGDPTGVSQGNPRLHAGDVLGYDIGGRPYVMPERGKRHDPAAWGAR